MTRGVSPTARETEISALIETLHATDRRLEELLAGEVDSVTDRRGHTIVLRNAQAQLRHSEEARRVSLSSQTLKRERMFSTMLSAITDFSYIIDRDGRFQFANQPLLEMWGLTLEQAVGRSFLELGYTEALAASMLAKVGEVFETGKHVSGERILVRADGTQGMYEYIFSPAFAADASVDFVVGVTRDISDRKASENALRKSEARFRILADAMPQIVWITQADGRNIYLNQQWSEYTGLTLKRSLGYGWNLAFHPDDKALASAAWQHAIRTVGIYSIESRMRRADGAWQWWLVRGVPYVDADDNVPRWIGTCTNIDELKVADLELQQAHRESQRQQEELRVLFDLVPAMIWFKDTENNILRVNERVAKMTGLTVGEIEGKPLADIYPLPPGQIDAEDQRIIESGVPVLGVVDRMPDSTGKSVWVQRDKVPYRDKNGKVIGIVVMAQDVTERIRDQDALRELNAGLEQGVRARTVELDHARREAEQANQAKSTFLATVSHEIRTPMHGLLGLLELLSLGRLDARQRSMLAVARESGSALQHIIDDILDFSKIEANSVELHLVSASVRDVVENACRLHAPAAAGKQLPLNVCFQDEISPHLMVDPLRLGQILNNFLNNAIKFTESGAIDVSVELAGHSAGTQALRFLVRDTGIGMSPSQLDRLFQPFVQGSADTSNRFGGTGLGLVISRRLAELMGGSVEMQSEPGVGTVMTLSLGLAIGSADAPQLNAGRQEALETLMAGKRPAPPVRQAQEEGTLLLVVDDHPVNRMVMLHQLASLGYAAEPAADGVEGLRAWKTGRFGAVITDCNMPLMSGYALAEAIRKIERRKGSGRTPIIACTANALPAATAMCISAGMDACLVKPAALADICAMLDLLVPLPQGIDSPLDPAVLDGISGGDAATSAQILREFREANEVDAASLREAAQAGDMGRVVHFAHRIRGASLMLGALALSSACGAVEEAGAAQDIAQLRIATAALELELQRLELHLCTLL